VVGNPLVGALGRVGVDGEQRDRLIG
jgi:hypothetical protein